MIGAQEKSPEFCNSGLNPPKEEVEETTGAAPGTFGLRFLVRQGLTKGKHTGKLLMGAAMV